MEDARDKLSTVALIFNDPAFNKHGLKFSSICSQIIILNHSIKETISSSNVSVMIYLNSLNSLEAIEHDPKFSVKVFFFADYSSMGYP